MTLETLVLRGLTNRQKKKAALLFSWFFLTIATLWLLKPVRVAALLVHLGAKETPYVRLLGVVCVAVVVAFYSWVVNKLSRMGVVVWANVVFGLVLLAFWLALKLWSPWIAAQRWFVWAVYVLVEIYSVVLVGIFWTYSNDVVDEDESNRLYGVIGVGGILGGAVGGAFVDLFTKRIGGVNLLFICAALTFLAAGVGYLTEAVIRPPARRVVPEEEAESHEGLSAALEGAREVKASRYLTLIVGIVVTYEFTATLTDYGISVVFEQSFRDEVLLTRMYGRLGWIVSATALASQLLLVPMVLPKKRIALLIPPVVMFVGAAGLVVLPMFAMAMFLAASDRGLNYSVHQATKESLYVPLTDAQKYKSKAFIDMFVDRFAKALAAFVLIAIIIFDHGSLTIALYVALCSICVWAYSAFQLGGYFKRPKGRGAPRSKARMAPPGTASPSALRPRAPDAPAAH
jgi:AAA family ATP:ADP antiporter